MTLIEIMIVLVVIGVIFGFALKGLGKVSKTKLREDSMKVAATLRTAYNMAAETGQHHRVVFDLEQQVYRIEACVGQMKLVRTDEEETPDEDKLEELEEKIENAREQMQNAQPGTLAPNTSDMVPEIVGADSPEAAADAAAALAGVRIGAARCRSPQTPDGKPDKRGEPEQLEAGRGILIRRIYVSHLRDPVKNSLVSINFFPLGTAEKAVIEIVNQEGDQYSLLVSRMTGRVEFRDGEIDVDDFMFRDGAGDREEERE